VPLPRSIAGFNRRVTNHVTLHLAGWMPGFAVVRHIGRRSGRSYRTPVNVFRDGPRYVFALTYGRESDWVRNVLAAGGCRIETRRRTVELADPELFTDRDRRTIPAPARWILRMIRSDEFLALSPSSASSRSSASIDRPPATHP
jgi:deazaflavin-dependent oxidoreductase (nitroreductase family)